MYLGQQDALAEGRCAASYSSNFCSVYRIFDFSLMGPVEWTLDIISVPADYSSAQFHVKSAESKS